MNFSHRPIITCTLFSALALGLGGCGESKIRVYLAPKEAPAPTPPAEAQPGQVAVAKPKPHLDYKLPAGWEEATPNSVSVVAFKMKNGAAEANVNITPLPNLAGKESMVVNMWRDQAGLPPIDDAELAKTLEPVDIGGGKGQMFEVLGAKEGGAPLRIVTAFLHEADASWFYKLSGEEALVTAQKPVFVEFLKSVHVHHEEHAPETTAAPAAPAAPAGGAPKWDGPVPEGWQVLAPGNMQVGKFAVPEKDGAKAEVSVSIFPNDTGGNLSNINRWLGQLSLPAVDEAGLAALVSPLDPALPGAVLADLKNENRAMLGAIVPRDGRWWFYKLLGDAPAVAAARDSFVAFAKTKP